jgi:cell volume regulation protein A
LLSRASAKIGGAQFLLFIVLGVLVGREGLGGASPDNYQLSFTFGTSALILILFDGGLNTPLDRVRAGIRPALVSATAWIAGTMALSARLFGFPWTEAVLLGAIVSPTDAAAVFSILRASGLQPKRRIAVVLELESGLNDPLAVILTFALTDALARHYGIPLTELRRVPLGLAVGAVSGALVARNVDFSSIIMYRMRHGNWIGVECGRTARIGILGALAAAAGGASQAGADAFVAR